jgi:hypothetical protein
VCSPSRVLTACAPLAAPRASRAEGIPARTRSGQRTGSSGRTPGSSPEWRRVSRSSGSSNRSRRTRSQKAGDGYPGRHVVSRAGQVDGAGSRKDSLEFGGLRKVGSIDPYGPDQSGESRLGRAKQTEAPSRVMNSEVTQLRSDSQEQRLGMAPDIRAHRRPVTAWFRVRCTSLRFSFPVTACASSASRAS